MTFINFKYPMNRGLPPIPVLTDRPHPFRGFRHPSLFYMFSLTPPLCLMALPFLNSPSFPTMSCPSVQCFLPFSEWDSPSGSHKPHLVNSNFLLTICHPRCDYFSVMTPLLETPTAPIGSTLPIPIFTLRYDKKTFCGAAPLDH